MMRSVLKRTRVGSITLWLLLATCCLPLVFLLTAAGQKRGTSPAAARARDRELLDRERDLRRVEQLIGAPKQPLIHLLTPQTLEDFRQLQMVNNKMMAAAMPTDAPDYKMIAAATTEIKKRAARLKDVLALPTPKDIEESAPPKKQEQSPPAASIKAQLLRLDKLVMGFVSNPLFRDPNTINPQLSTKARRDLDGIIELSQSVKKYADKLSKTMP